MIRIICSFLNNLFQKRDEIVSKKSSKLVYEMFVLSTILICITSFLLEQDSKKSLNSLKLGEFKVIVAILAIFASAVFSAFIYFYLFQQVYPQLEKLDKQTAKITLFDKNEFLKKLEGISFSTQIFLMETWTDLLLDDLGDKFGNAILSLVNDQNCSVRILLLNPEERELVLKRQNELNESKNENDPSYINVEDRMYLGLKKLLSISESDQISSNHRSKLEVKLYSNPPSLAIYTDQDDLFVTFFKRGESTTSGDFINFDRESPVSGFFLEQFDMTWQQAKNMSDIFYLSVKFKDQLYRRIKYIFFEERSQQKYYLDLQHQTKLSTAFINDHDNSRVILNENSYSYESIHLQEIPTRVANLFEKKYSGSTSYNLICLQKINIDNTELLN